MTSSASDVLIRRQVGQHFVVGFHGLVPSQDIKVLIQQYFVGSIILMKRNVEGKSIAAHICVLSFALGPFNYPLSDAAQVRQLVRDLQRLAKDAGYVQPLLIGIDQENGLVSAFSSSTAGTQFPGAMALAATGSSDLVEQVYHATGTELKSVGINWVYAPVGDVNSDPKNPVIGVRSFGDDAIKVAMLAAACSQGFKSAGVAATGKHFPGHGDTQIDSHLALPRIFKTKEEIMRQELVPFDALIKSGIPSIMTGHMAFPKLTGKDEPCSLSRKVTTDLLKGEMGFSGVVVTDCLEMDAIADLSQGGCGVEEGSLLAIQAGADVVMICHTYQRQVKAIERVIKAVEEGEVQMDALLDSYAKVEQMKRDYVGGWDVVLTEEKEEEEWKEEWASLQEVNRRLSRTAYSRSVVVLQDQPHIIPLDKEVFSREGKALLLLAPKEESVNPAVDSGEVEGNRSRRSPVAALESALSRRVTVKRHDYKPDDEVSPPLFEAVGAVLITLRNADLRRWQLAYLEQIYLKLREHDGHGRVPLIILSICGPYELGTQEVGRVLSEGSAGCIATFEFTAEAFGTSVEVLFGEEMPQGRMPVRLT